MATLTSTGINCSNGTLDGQYTGTTAQNTSYPIGSYLLVSASNITAFMNSNTTIYTPQNGGVYLFTYNPGTGSSVISGTWRSRGPWPAGCFNGFLAQRVA
jgi:hypothetical protein